MNNDINKPNINFLHFDHFNVYSFVADRATSDDCLSLF